jgi:hypothetical protein
MAQVNILFIGEQPVKAAPTLTLASEIEKLGFAAEFSCDAELDDPARWNRLMAWADIIIVVDYMGPGSMRLRQLARAAWRGKKIVRWWVGSDVLHISEQPRWRAAATILDRFTSANIAVSPHLVEELSAMGIAGTYIPSIVSMKVMASDAGQGLPPRAVLIYLPGNRLEFYGAELCGEVIRENTDIKFLVVGDDAHTLAGYGNVESLGWTNMDAVWPRTGALLRITRHDGMPRMVLEALSLGKYVIYAWEFPGCWHAKTKADVQEKLNAFRKMTGPNRQGVETVRHILQHPPAETFVQTITRPSSGPGFRLRIRALLTYLHLSVVIAMWCLKEKFSVFSSGSQK